MLRVWLWLLFRVKVEMGLHHLQHGNAQDFELAYVKFFFGEGFFDLDVVFVGKPGVFDL